MERHFHTILFFKTIKFSTLKVDMTFQITHQMNGQEQLVTNMQQEAKSMVMNKIHKILRINDQHFWFPYFHKNYLKFLYVYKFTDKVVQILPKLNKQKRPNFVVEFTIDISLCASFSCQLPRVKRPFKFEKECCRLNPAKDSNEPKVVCMDR